MQAVAQANPNAIHAGILSAEQLCVADVNPTCFHRHKLAHLTTNAKFGLEQHARAEISSQPIRDAMGAARMNGDAECRSNEQPPSDAPTEACGCEMRITA